MKYGDIPYRLLFQVGQEVICQRGRGENAPKTRHVVSDACDHGSGWVSLETGEKFDALTGAWWGPHDDYCAIHSVGVKEAKR